MKNPQIAAGRPKFTRPGSDAQNPGYRRKQPSHTGRSDKAGRADRGYHGSGATARIRRQPAVAREKMVSPNLWTWIVWYVGGAVIYGALGGAALGASLGIGKGRGKRGLTWGLVLGLVLGGIAGGVFFLIDLRARGILPKR